MENRSFLRKQNDQTVCLDKSKRNSRKTSPLIDLLFSLFFFLHFFQLRNNHSKQLKNNRRCNVWRDTHCNDAETLQSVPVNFTVRSPFAKIFTPVEISCTRPFFKRSFGDTFAPSPNAVFKSERFTTTSRGAGLLKPRTFGVASMFCRRPRSFKPETPDRARCPLTPRP